MRGMLVGAAVAALLVVPSTAAAAKGGRYSAEIRRAAGGMPHIKARDYGSLGFGYGYAYAEDQIGRFADIVTTVRAQRSRFFGPDASYGDAGGQTNNLKSDFFFQRINDSGIVERLATWRYPDGPGADVRATVKGFAAGWNTYLRRTERDRLPDPRCRGAKWVTPITVRDLYRRFYQLGERASGTALLDALLVAQGVYEPYTGSSFVMAAELTRNGPRGRAILRYSQSENPRSRHYADQTRLYAQQNWLPLRFTDRQIKGDAGYSRKRVTGGR